ncbi:Zinc finger protein [Schistosoma japonicum]|nr:Zinc finger protein [Schistosoma japonicum]KAH8855162.1 Zinc finger protein [Schistosoma japonicum]
MIANQHNSAAVSYTFNQTNRQQRQIQIVDANSLQPLTESLVTEEYKRDEVPVQNTQVVYGTTAASGFAPVVGQNIQLVSSVPNTIELANNAYDSSLVVPQEPSQASMDIEPIDLEEVQKIQARMPAADPNAPVGSNKNPIRIIQQGNQYITTQDVSDEHLQQIIQVLTNQALLSSSGSRPSAIYNRLTNRRIIFRVTRAKRRHDDGNTGATTLSSERNRSSITLKSEKKSRAGRPIGRKRRKRGSDEEDPDFEPEVPEEEVLPFPLIRRTSASGRVSKPPKHLVKDYKHLRLEDLTSKPESSEEDEHSDGGYSDYINDGLSDEGWSEDGMNRSLRWPCPLCTKVFTSRAGVARHRSIAHGPNRGRPRGRWANPYMASVRRRAKLKEAVAEATDDDLIEFVAPRLCKLISPWDHLLLRSEHGSPPLPQVPRVVLDYLSLVERARSFLCDQLELRLTKKSKISNESNSENCRGEQSAALGLPCGKYVVKEPLREEYLPRRFRSILAAQRANAAAAAAGSDSEKESVGHQKRAVVALETAEDDEVDATLRSDITSTEDSVQHFGDVTNSNQTADNNSQNIVSLGEELLLLPDGGLGCPVPDEWLASGAFLTVLTENGQTSDLVMEAATGRLFHRPTGHLVSLADSQQANQSEVDFQGENYEYESNSVEQSTRVVTTPRQQASDKRKGVSSKSKSSAKSRAVTEEPEVSSDVLSQQEQLLAQLAENGDVIDLNTLFPGVSVTEVSPGVCLVTKPNGDRFNVEHGGEGLTLETLQAILQMDA